MHQLQICITLHWSSTEPCKRHSRSFAHTYTATLHNTYSHQAPHASMSASGRLPVALCQFASTSALSVSVPVSIARTGKSAICIEPCVALYGKPCISLHKRKLLQLGDGPPDEVILDRLFWVSGMHTIIMQHNRFITRFPNKPKAQLTLCNDSNLTAIR